MAIERFLLYVEREDEDVVVTPPQVDDDELVDGRFVVRPNGYLLGVPYDEWRAIRPGPIRLVREPGEPTRLEVDDE